MSRLLHHRGISIPVRVGLGCIFIWASLPKIIDPPGFAQMLWNYGLLPDSLINPLAIVMPWAEMLAGVALVAGVMRRGAAMVIGCMLIAFMAGLGINLARGIAVDCGCFSVTSTVKTHAELIGEMKFAILRDFGMLLMALQVLFARVNWAAIGGQAGRSRHGIGNAG